MTAMTAQMTRPSPLPSAMQMEAEGYRPVGPYGGPGGNPFSDNLTTITQLIAVTVRSGDFLDAIQATWRTTDGNQVTGPWHGGEGTNARTFVLEDGEFINKVRLNSGSKVDKMILFTNKGHRFDCGGTSGGGALHEIDGNVYGFFGRSGKGIDSVGFFVK
jgi:Jacalin-like lectin domain